MTTPALLPCPKCRCERLSYGNTHHRDDGSIAMDLHTFIFCCECRFEGPHCVSTELAEGAWNHLRRPATKDAELAAAWEKVRLYLSHEEHCNAAFGYSVGVPGAVCSCGLDEAQAVIIAALKEMGVML